MEEIVVNRIRKAENAISFDFSVSEGLAGYFSGKPFVIEYPENIESVPDAVAAVPFVCNVLPIIWLTNSVLRVKELDKAFYECIPNVRKGYEAMFPESTFAGEVVVEHVVPCDRLSDGGSAMFFSGGLDATQTLVSHFQEKPDLISIWGSDIRFDNCKGWQLVHQGIQESAAKLELLDVVIRSSFREFDDEGALQREYFDQLKDGWWHGVKHGIGLLGHAAPYAFLHGLGKVYIASSNCPDDGKVRCASNPAIDNHVRFCGCQVVHDGFEYNRQDKVHNVVKFCRENGKLISLHVCWESQQGGNCCVCEKCYRTMAGLLVEGVNPEEYGFRRCNEVISEMQIKVLKSHAFNANVANSYWRHIKNRLIENKQILRNKPYWKDIKWIEKADFENIEHIKLPLKYRFHETIHSLNHRIRAKMATFSWYQRLHEIKERVKHA